MGELAKGVVIEAAPETEAVGQRVAKATGAIMVFHVLRFVLGFLEKPLLAHYFGATAVTDAYAVARDIVTRIWLIFEKVINPSFLPCFIEGLKRDERRAWQFTNTVAVLMTALLLISTLLGWSAAPWLARFYSERAAPEQIRLTITMTRIMLIGLIFLGWSSLTYVILNGYKRFALAALGDALWKGAIMGAVAFIVPIVLRISEGKRSVAIISLAAGFLIGSLGKLAPQLLGLWSKRRFFRLEIFWQDELLRKMALLIPPLLIGIFVSEYRGIMMLKFAGRVGEGAQAALTQYARPPVDALIFIFPYALSISIFPFLADLHLSRAKQQFTNAFIGAVRVCLFFFLPLSVGFIALRYPIVRALFESGAWTPQATELTVAAFTFFAAGMVIFAAEPIINQTFYSMANTLIPNSVGIATSLLGVGFAWLAVTVGWGIGGIALAETFAKGTKCIILTFLLRPHLTRLRLREQAIFVLKVGIATALALLVAWGIVQGGQELWTAEEVTRTLRLMRLGCIAAGFGLGFVIYVLACRWLNISEAHIPFTLARKVWQKFLSRGS